MDIRKGRILEKQDWMPDQEQRKDSLADEAHRRLEKMFVTLELTPGGRWSEEALVKRLEIGRTPVREALLRMHYDNLISIRKNYGIVISEIDGSAQVMAIEVRRSLERLIASKAAIRATQAEREKLLRFSQQMQDIGAFTVHDYLDILFKINDLIADISQNPFAQRAISPLHSLSRRFYFYYHDVLDNLAFVGRLHAARAVAIVEGSQAAAMERTDHLMDVVENYTARIVMGSARS